MSKNRIFLISLGWLIALALLLAGIIYSANKEEMETNKWLEQVKSEVSKGTVHTYKVKHVLSVKNPLTDELDSISTIFFSGKVDKTKIKVVEAFVETNDKKGKTVKIITEVNNSKDISNIDEVSGILIKGKIKEEELIVNTKIEQK